MPPNIIVIALSVPCFLVKTGDGFVMIDSGLVSDRDRLEKELDRAKVTSENLKLLLLTHGDFDHAGNAAFIQKKFSVKIAMHPDDVGMVEHGDQTWNRKNRSDRITLFGRIIISISGLIAKPAQFRVFHPDILVADGQDLTEFGLDARVIHLPGHSRGSIGILTDKGDLFCGDLLMNMTKPDFHFMIDDFGDLKASLNKLATMGVKTVYPGHGKPFSLDAFIQRHPDLLPKD
jgi:hydroxyacylglutathione hydrolase